MEDVGFESRKSGSRASAFDPLAILHKEPYLKGANDQYPPQMVSLSSLLSYVKTAAEDDWDTSSFRLSLT